MILILAFVARADFNSQMEQWNNEKNLREEDGCTLMFIREPMSSARKREAQIPSDPPPGGEKTIAGMVLGVNDDHRGPLELPEQQEGGGGWRS